MTDPNPAHDPHRRADGEQPSWYGGDAGAGSSGTGSSAAGWPDAPAADRAGWDQAPSYAEQQAPASPGHGHDAAGYGGAGYGDAGYGGAGYDAAGYAPAYGQGGAPYGYGAPLAPGQTEGTGRSVASMIIGILSIIGGLTLLFPPIVGVILGHMGLKREPNGRGMAIAGLVMNYLSLALLLLGVVLVTILIVAGMAATGYSTY